MPCEQTLHTQWLEDLFCEPSHHNEPPIPGPCQSSQSQVPSHEKASTCEPEPEVTPAQSTEEPLVCPHFTFFTLTSFQSPFLQKSPACPATCHCNIIIDNTPVSSPSNSLFPDS
ncbi:hypothetical protein O181_051566 [Austropuccinia psidii MF-1]|uniref:Uncharacterized protein n=1 Tax=Austropuccinia psidii MF-1 TaxID=1389203 RepID=A0A9Q3E3Z5_9BASI|nr:hypothetical protein [Austropuccinia psidii MF-1]